MKTKGMNFMEACKDVLENRTEYTRERGVSIRFEDNWSWYGNASFTGSSEALLETKNEIKKLKEKIIEDLENIHPNNPEQFILVNKILNKRFGF